MLRTKPDDDDREAFGRWTEVRDFAPNYSRDKSRGDCDGVVLEDVDVKIGVGRDGGQGGNSKAYEFITVRYLADRDAGELRPVEVTETPGTGGRRETKEDDVRLDDLLPALARAQRAVEAWTRRDDSPALAVVSIDGLLDTALDETIEVDFPGASPA